MPYSESTIADLKTGDPKETIVALTALQERAGPEGLRKAMGDLFAQSLPADRIPKARSIGQFLREVGTPPPMLVDRLLPQKALILLTGKPKLGKSYMAIQIAEDVQQGRAVFGEYMVNHTGPVLYIGMEDGDFEFANRFLNRGWKADQEGALYLVTERMVLSSEEGIATLRLVISNMPEEHQQPVLIIIDTARESLGIKDWNDAAQVSDAFRPLREFARDNCTVLLVAHNRKQAAETDGDEIAGSGAVASSVDGWISGIHGEVQSGGLRLVKLKIVGRGAMNSDAIIEIQSPSAHIRYVPVEEIQDAMRVKTTEELRKKHLKVVAALDLLKDRKGTIQQIADQLGVKHEAARRLINEAEKDCFICKTGETIASEGRSANVYTPTEGRDLSSNPLHPIDNRGKEEKPPSTAAPPEPDLSSLSSDQNALFSGDETLGTDDLSFLEGYQGDDEDNK